VLVAVTALELKLIMIIPFVYRGVRATFGPFLKSERPHFFDAEPE